MEKDPHHKQISSEIKNDFESFLIEKKAGKKIGPQWLISFDLDGTILGEDFENLDNFTRVAIEKIIEKYGNFIAICLSTGKKELSSLPYYFQLGLDKIESYHCSYSGALLSNPSKPGVFEKIYEISNTIAKNLLEEHIVKQHVKNILIDTVEKVTICTSESPYFNKVFFDDHPFTKVNIEDIISSIGQSDILQMVLEIPNNSEIIDEFSRLIRSKYNISISFYKSNNLKEDKEKNYLVPDDTTVMLRIRSSMADKSKAILYVCTYLNIDFYNKCIAFGDDKNDSEILRKSRLGIVMKNAKDEIKSLGKWVTKFKNSESGVGRYLNKILDLGLEYK